MTIKSFAGKTLLLAAVLATACTALAAKPKPAADSRVQVTWTNPDEFSDAKQRYGAGLRRESADEWLGELAKHLRYRAERILPTDQTLQVTFTDVQRAGTYEPWRGPQWDDVRIIKDIYPPRIDLEFTLTDANGNVIQHGERRLRDPAFLQRGILNTTDPLRFEKRMLDDWLRSEFANAGDANG